MESAIILSMGGGKQLNESGDRRCAIARPNALYRWNSNNRANTKRKNFRIWLNDLNKSTRKIKTWIGLHDESFQIMIVYHLQNQPPAYINYIVVESRLKHTCIL